MILISELNKLFKHNQINPTMRMKKVSCIFINLLKEKKDILILFKGTPRNIDLNKRTSPKAESDEDFPQKPTTTHIRSRSSSPKSNHQTTSRKNSNNNEKISSIHSGQSLNDDSDENEDNTTAKNNISNNQNEGISSSSRPKTRRGRDATLNNNEQENSSSNKNQKNSEIWRPSSELDKKEPVDPLVGLDDLQNPSARSNEQKHSSSNSNNTENQFKNWYPKGSEDEEDN